MSDLKTIADADLEAFDLVGIPGHSPTPADVTCTPSAASVDLMAKMRQMWR